MLVVVMVTSVYAIASNWFTGSEETYPIVTDDLSKAKYKAITLPDDYSIFCLKQEGADNYTTLVVRVKYMEYNQSTASEADHIMSQKMIEVEEKIENRTNLKIRINADVGVIGSPIDSSRWGLWMEIVIYNEGYTPPFPDSPIEGVVITQVMIDEVLSILLEVRTS